MGDIVPLKTGKGTAREQLLEMATHQARMQGKSPDWGTVEVKPQLSSV